MVYLYCSNCVYLIMRMADHFLGELLFPFWLSHTSLKPTGYFILCVCPNLLNYILMDYLCCFQMTVNIFVHRAFSLFLLDFFCFLMYPFRRWIVRSIGWMFMFLWLGTYCQIAFSRDSTISSTSNFIILLSALGIVNKN